MLNTKLKSFHKGIALTNQEQTTVFKKLTEKYTGCP